MSLRPTPATNETAGTIVHPPYTRRWTVEVLECGHDGRITNPYRAVTRRRCWRCAR